MFDTAYISLNYGPMIQIWMYIIKRKKKKTYKDASMHQIKKDSKHYKGEAWELGYQDKMIKNEGE